MKIKLKQVLWIVGGIAVLALALFLVYHFAFDPYRGTETDFVESLPLESMVSKAKAEKDINYVMKMLRSRHPAWLEDQNARVQNTEQQYEEEMMLLSASNADEISVLEEWRILSRIMHELYDGHSSVYCNYAQNLYIDDFTQINTYGMPLKINGEVCEDVLRKFLDVYQYETESFAEATFGANVIVNETYLQWIGVDTANGVDYTYLTDEGEQTYHYTFVPISEVKGFEQSDDAEKAPWVYYDIDTANSIGIFTLRDCSFNDEYKQTVKAFFDAVAQNQVESVIIDLRWNGGGSSLVGNEFLRYLDIDGYYGWPSHVRYGNILIKNKKVLHKNNRLEPQFSGDVYVLTNSRTYSAAMDFTMLIMDNGIGKVVGEASGNLPDSYGDLLKFVTPNAKISFTVSYKRWFRIDETKAGEALMPDYPCASEEAMDQVYEVILGK